jgi:anti-sigma factor RsiW
MADRDLPVTQDELHAYVDGEIPADRRPAVEAWLATHPDDAAHVAEWRAQAASIRARYGAVATEPVPARLTLDRIGRRVTASRGAIAATAAAVFLAFVAGGAVGWLARDASATAPSRFDVFTAQALDAHKVYVVEVRHPVEVAGAERPHLVQWLSKRLDHELKIPQLEPSGLKLVGGRLLPGPFGPAAFCMYEGASGERFTIYYARTDAAQTAMHYRAAERLAAFYWVEQGLAYVITGPSDRERLLKVAQAAYDQIDKDAPVKSTW